MTLKLFDRFPIVDDEQWVNGGSVAVLIPNAKVAARWNGALEARLRQAPIESFLRSRGQHYVASGDTRATDNLAAATLYLLERAIDCRLEQVSVVGLVACAVSDGLAALIRERSAWRTAALVGTARILSPSIGPAAAADLSAAAVREYSMSLGGPPKNLNLPNIRAAAARAVQSNDESHVVDAVCLMSKQLFAASALLSAAEARAATSSLGVRAGAALQPADGTAL
jgi:hypothetical protein